MPVESTRSPACREAEIVKPGRSKNSPLFPHASRRWCHKFNGRFFNYRKWKLIDAADVHLTAMISLGVNAALGNHDCGTLPRWAVDLTGGWIEFPRSKIGEPR